MKVRLTLEVPNSVARRIGRQRVIEEIEAVVSAHWDDLDYDADCKEEADREQ